MKIIFGKEFVEVVPGDATRNARKFLADERGIAVANALESGVNFAYAAAGADERFKLFGGVEPTVRRVPS